MVHVKFFGRFNLPKNFCLKKEMGGWIEDLSWKVKPSKGFRIETRKPPWAVGDKKEMGRNNGASNPRMRAVFLHTGAFTWNTLPNGLCCGSPQRGQGT